MAIVTEFERVTKSRQTQPTETVCGHAVVDVGGATMVLLETYGSGHRKIPGKVSQSLHFNRDRAAELKSILEHAFPGI